MRVRIVGTTRAVQLSRLRKYNGKTLIKRKSRMPQIQDGKGETVPLWAGLRTLDNEGDGVSSAIPKGKQRPKKVFNNYVTKSDLLDKPQS